MANENNKIKELAPDDDGQTAELEALTCRLDQLVHVEREADADTQIGARTANQQSSQETNSRLRYDFEQLRAKWLGLKTEIKARGEQVGTLNRELSELLDRISRKEKLLKNRDSKIKLLKSEIRQRNEQFRSLSSQFIALQQILADDAAPALEDPNAVPGNDRNVTTDELLQKLTRVERYADSIRQKLQDMIAASSVLQSERDHLVLSLATTKHRNDDCAKKLDSQVLTIKQLNREISSVKEQHVEEIRLLRFELGEAQDTVVQAEDINDQLTSDLVDTRHFKDQLESMLCDAENQAESKVTKLEKKVSKLSRTIESNEQKISTKSGAISVLLGELAKMSKQTESIGDVEDVQIDIGDQTSEQCDDNADENDESRTIKRPGQSRITRLLVGKIGAQVLRFPLFKDKLTIGRTEDNDIQLNAAFISRHHAVIQTEGDTTRVIDWGSKNGVQVNSKRIKEHFLVNGDVLTIGNARFRYEERKKRGS